MGDVVAAGATGDSLYEELLAAYRVHVRDPVLYPGARSFLERTAAAGVPLVVLTNKPLETAGLTLQAAGLTALFARVLAPENAGRKPDPAGLLALLRESGVPPEGAVLFGDSGIDFETGRRAGVFTVGLRGGYGKAGDPEPDLWADDWETLGRWWQESAPRTERDAG